MSDAQNQPLDQLLSGLSLGPSWAKPAHVGKSDTKAMLSRKGGEMREPREDRQDQRGPRQGGDRFRKDRRDGPRDFPPRREEILPAPGVMVSLVPAPEAVRLIGREIQHEARVYPLFEISRTLLSERSRCRAVFEVPEPLPFLWRGLAGEAVFLTKDDALHHLWNSELRAQFIEQETVESEPPKGNFTAVARCGLSGEWLGPPNFHAYQTNLRRFHRERFAHLPFESYSAKVRVEKGEEAVNAWLATMTTKTRWRLVGSGDDAWIEDEALAKREVAARCFDSAFEEARCIEVNAGIPAAHLSPALMASLKQAGNHAKNHPAFLIPAVCKALEAEHLPVFKRQGKLDTGPARPHPLPADQILAERPSMIVEWIRSNPPAKLEGLWKAVSPDGSGAPPAEFAADLFWLLQQGNILLFPDDTLMVQEVRAVAASDAPESASAGGKKKKRKSKKAFPTSLEAEPSQEADASAEDAFQDTIAMDAEQETGNREHGESATDADGDPEESMASSERDPDPTTPAKEMQPSPSPGVDEPPAM